MDLQLFNRNDDLLQTVTLTNAREAFMIRDFLDVILPSLPASSDDVPVRCEFSERFVYDWKARFRIHERVETSRGEIGTIVGLFETCSSRPRVVIETRDGDLVITHPDDLFMPTEEIFL